MTKWQLAQTPQFEAWLDGLADRKARVVIAKRIERIQAGNLGDHESVGDGVHEFRSHYGPGYRLYYTIRDGVVILLLAGGSKSTQRRDIRRAKKLAADLRGVVDEQDRHQAV